ncbi:hypothetical protein EGO55_19555 [Caenibius tardaugens NBRC 16725]|nr:hypothetical protein [Caenibius tardaugens]AZI37888.1 hypothetical protein EGO55_19555 [Caenibius tardaugens NBRC 16725]
MVANVTRHPAYIVDDDDDFGFPVLADEAEHGVEAGAAGELARHVIIEHFNDFMAATMSIFAAPRLLRSKSVAFFGLALRRNATVNDRLVICFSCHGEKSLRELSSDSEIFLLNLSLSCLPDRWTRSQESFSEKAQFARAESDICTLLNPYA